MLNTPIICRIVRSAYFQKLAMVHLSEGLTDFTGFQNYEKPFPNRLAKVQTLFDKHIGAMTKAKQSFLDEVGATALTLSPKDSFELRLWALHVLNPGMYPLDDDDILDLESDEDDFDEVEASKPTYRFDANKLDYILNFNFVTDQVDEAFMNFVVDDSRYSVKFGCMELNDGNKKYDVGAEQYVTMTIKEKGQQG
jgi:hypothetical protein